MALLGFTHLLRLVGEIRAEVVAGIDLHPPPGAIRDAKPSSNGPLCPRALASRVRPPTFSSWVLDTRTACRRASVDIARRKVK